MATPSVNVKRPTSKAVKDSHLRMYYMKEFIVSYLIPQMRLPLIRRVILYL